MLCKRGQQDLFCLRKLAKFQVDKTLMKLFYSAFIESVISFPIVCWYGNLCTRDKNSLGRIVKTASKIAGVHFRGLDHFFSLQVLKKARAIRTDEAHPLYCEYELLPSGLRFRAPLARKNRYKNSFVPVSIRAINNTVLM